MVTRVGHDTRLILTGDIPQADLPHNGKDKSGMRQLLEVINNVKDFEEVRFTQHDIVRSDFVKSWIIATEGLVAYA